MSSLPGGHVVQEVNHTAAVAKFIVVPCVCVCVCVCVYVYVCVCMKETGKKYSG